ncbi:P-loop containing nucleoside triphosphate hydrolase protein [Butyriboletus roseoflavus]|nr:P-loop containing nucleoside triphosphate hydrolase protein [Butyriboletus roseoflavus]
MRPWTTSKTRIKYAPRTLLTSNDYHSAVDEDDIVIAVMGPTGTGKSSFVNKAAGREEAMIGYSLTSETRMLQPVRCPHPDGRRNVVLVDTPGFDDTHLSDTQILRILANWLKNTYQNNIKLAGLLYLHRISDVRLAGTPLRNLGVFQNLCGTENLKNVVIVTTMWDEVEDQSVGSKREEELLSSFWKGMIDLGSRTCRFQGTRESAWEIIDHLDLEGSREGRTPLQIQREMVDKELPLHETAAGKTLFHSLVELTGEFKKSWTKMRNGVRRATDPRKPSLGLPRNAILSESHTLSSSPTSSVVSRTDTASISSRDSAYLSIPAGTTSSGCTANGRRDSLLATIAGLRLAHQVADIASIPVIRVTIGTVLRIAQMIEGMGGTHHAITQVVDNSGWLLGEIAQDAAKSQLSRDMKKALNSFQRELNNLQTVVTKIEERGHVARFFLQDMDIQVITACTTSIKEVYDILEVRSS